jgi:hypothetical protein
LAGSLLTRHWNSRYILKLLQGFDRLASKSGPWPRGVYAQPTWGFWPPCRGSEATLQITATNALAPGERFDLPTVQALHRAHGLHRDFSGSAPPAPALTGKTPNDAASFASCCGTVQSLPLTGFSTLGSDPARFQAEPPACYRASWQPPGPDSHWQATTSYEHEETPRHYVRHDVTSCSAGRTKSRIRVRWPMELASFPVAATPAYQLDAVASRRIRSTICMASSSVIG